MRAEDPIAPMIPWYANGTLSAEERPRLEQHLTSCADCRGLLEQALELKDLLGSVVPERMEDHLQAQLLAEIAADPEGLGQEGAEWARSHLAGCAACADAVEVCRESLTPLVPAAALEEAPRSAASFLARLWGYLGGTWLRPLPALAYLLVAAVLAVPAVRRAGEAVLAPAVLPRTVAVSGEPTFRAGAEPMPAIEIPAGGVAVLLELRTAIDPEDLRDPAALFRIEIRRGEEAIWSEERSGGTFGADGTIPLLLDPGALPGAASYRVVIVYQKMGDPMDGRTVFQRTFRIARSTGNPGG